MDADLIAALERVLWELAVALPEKDYSLIRAHIDRLRNGGERAQIVAYLRAEAANAGGDDDLFYDKIADAIEAGAHRGEAANPVAKP